MRCGLRGTLDVVPNANALDVVPDKRCKIRAAVAVPVPMRNTVLYPKIRELYLERTHVPELRSIGCDSRLAAAAAPGARTPFHVRSSGR
jgi:hypothetical protein